MKIPMIFSKIGTAMQSVAGNGMLVAKKYAPELMIGGGIAGFIGTIAATVKATNKTNDILAEKENAVFTIENVRRDSEYAEHGAYSEKDYDKDMKAVNRRTRGQIIRAWIPVATLGAASTAAVLGGYRILNGRYVATAAAYKVLESGFDRYRGNVIERYGKETDWELLNGVKAEEMAKAREEQEKNKEIEADNKRKKFGKKRKQTAYSDIYNRIFDEYSDRWQRCWIPEQVIRYLQVKENELNDRLMIKGSVMLNDVYDALGLERTAEGCVVGWIKSAHERVDIQNRNVIQIVSNLPESEIREILSTTRNEDIRVHIRPNPDGLIYNLIDQNRRPNSDGLDRIEQQKLAYYD